MREWTIVYEAVIARGDTRATVGERREEWVDGADVGQRQLREAPAGARGAARRVRNRPIRRGGGGGGALLRNPEVHPRPDHPRDHLDRAERSGGGASLGPLPVHPPQPRLLDP